MKQEVLAYLKSSTGWVSGQDLCNQLGVSRTAVWKAINQLKAEGYEVTAIRNKGYRLDSIPDVLTEVELTEKIGTKWAGQTLECHITLDSTNNRGKEAADEGAPHGTLIIAETQEAGKGRLGRTWISEPKASIYMSLVLKPNDLPPEKAPMLTLVAALAVAEGLKARTGLETKIKWPNDVVANGKKLCGILTEMNADMDRIRYIITGIGINVNIKSFPEELPAATSLYLETGQVWSRGDIIATILGCYEEYYQRFIETGDLSGLMETYNQCLVNANREVKVLEPRNEYIGVAEGINEKGELLIRTKDDEVHKVISGEVSVRGLYGYV